MSEIASKIVADILADLQDRSGIGNELDAIDDGIREEMTQSLVEIVDNILDENKQLSDAESIQTQKDSFAQVVLDELKKERERFSRANKDRMQFLVDRLIQLGVYPTQSQCGTPALAMVDSYGVDWYKYGGQHNCPHCDADLCDRKNGPPFKLEIGVTQNDCCVRFDCPVCHKAITE